MVARCKGGFRRNGGREPFQRPLRSTNLNQLRASSAAPFLGLSTATVSPAISSDVAFLAFHAFYCLSLGLAPLLSALYEFGETLEKILLFCEFVRNSSRLSQIHHVMSPIVSPTLELHCVQIKILFNSSHHTHFL